MADREWKFDDSVGLVFAGVQPKEEHVFSLFDDALYDTFNELVDRAAEDPEAAIGHLTAIVYHMGHTMIDLKHKADELRKDLDAHGHKDAVVVSY